MTELFEAKVRRVGTSLGIIIPKEAGVREGELVKISILREDRELRKKILNELLGSAKGAAPFERDRRDRLDRYK